MHLASVRLLTKPDRGELVANLCQKWATCRKKRQMAKDGNVCTGTRCTTQKVGHVDNLS